MSSIIIIGLRVQIASRHRTVPRFGCAERPKWCDFESAQWIIRYFSCYSAICRLVDPEFSRVYIVQI